MRYNFIKKLILLLALSACVTLSAQDSRMAVFRDSIDHAFDISNWLLNKKGVLIVPTVITEPALGYGVAAAAIYFHSSYTDLNGPPDMSGVIGGGTENGTRVAGAFHAGFWNHDRIRYMGAIMRTYINIGFYGGGQFNFGENQSVNLNMDAWLVLQQVKFRLGKSDFFAGGRFIYYDTDNTLNTNREDIDIDGYNFKSTLTELSAVLNYDSRNSIYTPTGGLFAQLTPTYSDTWMGGDADYGRFSATFIGYMRANKRLVVGLRHESIYSFGDIPGYARPIINLRGAPLMKYQDQNCMLMEAELNWNVYRRWYLTGFTGMGNAFKDFDLYDNGKSVTTIGSGFRYLVARKLGAQMGMDFAKSPDDFAIYIIFGCAWLR